MPEETHANSTSPSLDNNSSQQQVKQPLWRDLLIPASIVLAGVAVGAGLYLGGGSEAPGVVANNNYNDPQPISLVDMAVAAGANKDEFTSCFENGETLALVQEDMENAVATGGRGTPWGVVIGPTGNKYVINGAIPQASIEQLIAVAKSEAGIEKESTPETEKLEAINPITEDDHIKGDFDALVKVVEYSDFDCPFCTRFHSTMQSVVDKDSDVAWVYRHFPLESLHPQATAIAVASECVAKVAGEEAFWSFTDSYLK